MKLNSLHIILLFASILFACNSSSPKEEKAKPLSYTSKEIGWTIEIPVGFQSLSKARIKANEKRGKEAIGGLAEGEIKLDSLQYLINFQKNQFNSFGATIEHYIQKKTGDYITNTQLIKSLIYDTYTQQKIKVDTLSGKVNVAGRSFYTFNITVYGPTGEVLMNQILFNQFIKGYDFGVNINYNNEADKKLLMDAFLNSKFN